MNLRTSLIALFCVLCVGISLAWAIGTFDTAQDQILGHETPPWELLARIEIEDTSDDILPNMIKTFPDEVIAAAQDFQIEGYLIRFVAEPYLREFMIVPDSPECPFCGGAGYGPYLEVQMREPLDDLPNYTKLHLVGQLEFIDDPKIFDAVKLTDAVLLNDPS